ncbi:MAG: hypothetical protein DMD78_08780 [Candidatus Rokuibacteriota bacterium]|nr:MAG: hypothetical protein DMD78_08780 [Candidatus Rokubacteria bacterium]
MLAGMMSMLAAMRIAVWTLVVGKLVGAWGLTWDIQWHLRIGRDSFWIPPHVMMYAGVAAGFVVAFGVLALETWRARGGRLRPGTIRVAGLVGTRGFHLAAWGVALVILAAPIDDLWHRLFGLDITLWSPPHLLGLLGSAVNTVGTLLAAIEAYPPRRRERWIALLLGGALLYGGTRVVLEPAWLTAYAYGGVAFHAFAMLGALVLPLALVPAARLLGHRWAPIALVATALAISIAGERIAQAGFAVVQPVSVIEQEIAKDPTSTIAQAATIRAKSRGALTPFWLRLLLPLAAAGVLAAIDVRRRPGLAGAAYGIALVALYGWSTSKTPAFAPLVPSASETTIALAIAALAGLAGATAGRYVADALESRPAPAPAVAVPAHVA